jgi:hypothetical protein
MGGASQQQSNEVTKEEKPENWNAGQPQMDTVCCIDLDKWKSS